MFTFLRLTTVIGLMLLSFGSQALSVIVHPSNTAVLTKSDIADIFLGKKLEFENGETIKPVSLGEENEVTLNFVDSVLNKTPAQLKSYWARLIFTGQGEPPVAVDSEQQLLEIVASDPNAIGFVSGKSPGGVKVVAEF